MGFEAGFSDGGPAAALAIVSARLGRTVDAAALRERFFAHDTPHSLRALVEIAAELGLVARAFRGEIGNLTEIVLPAVVHLRHPARDEAGFAVLVEQRPGGYVLEEGIVAERHELGSAEFARLWAGVVVTFEPRERAEAPRPRRAGALRRAGTWLRGGDLATPQQEAALRIALLGLALLALACALRLAVVERSPLVGAAAALAVLLTLLAAVVARELYLVGRRSLVPTATPRLASKICRKGTHADCEGVLSSRYSSVLGVDLSSLGLAFFGSSGFLLALGAVLPAESLRSLITWLAAAHLLVLPGSLWLILVQVYPLRRFCPLCMACHAAVIVCAGLGAGWLAGSSALPVAGAIGFALLHALAFAGALGLAVPYVGLGLEVHSHRTRLGWISTTPWGALAEMLGRPRASSPLPATPFRLGRESTPFRIDALVHPICPGCGPVVDKLERLVERHPQLLAAGLHVPPRDLLRPGDVALCQALYATSRVAGGAKALALFRAVKAEPWKLMAEAESGLDGLLERFALEREAARAALVQARQDVQAADALYEALQRGTPAVLLNGKPWESTLEDLNALLTRYPDLLAALLGVALEPSDAPPRAASA